MSGCFLSDGDLTSVSRLKRAVAQLGRAPRSGRGGRGFESHQPDEIAFEVSTIVSAH
jgi:hypothetical protein